MELLAPAGVLNRTLTSHASCTRATVCRLTSLPARTSCRCIRVGRQHMFPVARASALPIKPRSAGQARRQHALHTFLGSQMLAPARAHTHMCTRATAAPASPRHCRLCPDDCQPGEHNQRPHLQGGPHHPGLGEQRGGNALLTTLGLIRRGGVGVEVGVSHPVQSFPSQHRGLCRGFLRRASDLVAAAKCRQGKGHCGPWLKQ